MDEMDLDQIIEVPDTPDRLVNTGINGRNGVRFENQRSLLPNNGRKMFPEEGSRDQPMIIDSGSRGPSPRPPKSNHNPKNSQCPRSSTSLSLARSPSSRNADLYRKGVTEKTPTYLTHDSMHKHLESARPSYTSKSHSSSQDEGILDLNEWSLSLNERARGNASSSVVPEKNQADFQKRSGLSYLMPSSHDVSHSASTSCYGNGEKKNPSRGGGLSIAFGDRIGSDNVDKKKPETVVLSPNSIPPPRVNRQKRLVRNGCISPNNIAKAERLVGDEINRHKSGSAAIEHNTGSMVSNPPPVSIDLRDLVAEDEDSFSRKGKGVVSHPSSSRRLDLESKNKHSRSTMTPSQMAVESVDYDGGAGKSAEEEVAGWRRTRNRTRVTREMNNTSLLNKDSLVRERVTPGLSIQQHENRLNGRGKEISVSSSDDFGEGTSFISSENFRAQSLKESVSLPRARSGRLNGLRSASDTHLKRQKQGSRLSSHGECSTSVSDDLVRSLSNLRSGSSNTNMPQIIEVDESSPQVSRDTHNEDARARQLEADELMARELQEQYYNEPPAFGSQEAVGSSHIHSQGRPQVADAARMSNLLRQSRSSVPRRGPTARSSSLGRMTRLRSRFPGQPRTLTPSQGRSSIFPASMDIEMRMHILGALEEFDIGMSSGILHSVTNRDFTEDDYEMLLALDDNNNHGGASNRQINGLPQSTLQSDLEEPCAVCLETPTAGDVIRHLPCFHKFHKACIDPWLSRKTSCPVCKSSIT